MHWHHRDDIDGCCDSHESQPVLATILATLDRMEIQIMSALQDSIDALAANFGAALDAISAEIDSLKATPLPVETPVDFSALDAALAKAQALAPAPVDVPVDVPAADLGQPDTDPGAAPAQGVPSVPLA